MDNYVTQMSLYTIDNVIFYQVFSTSLKGATLSWFTRLPPCSIYSFQMLVSRFGVQFSTNQPHHMTSLAVINIKQEKGESLRLFMERFSKLALHIQDLNLEVTLHHMITALRPKPFVDTLCKKLVTDLN